MNNPRLSLERIRPSDRSNFVKAKPYVFRIGHLGDTLAAIPALRVLSKKHSPTPLTLITNSPAYDSYVTAWDVLKHTGLFDDVLFYETRRPSTLIRIASEMRHSRNPVLYYLPPVGRRHKLRDWTFFRVLCGASIEALDSSAPLRRRGPDRALVRLPREFERLLGIFGDQHQPREEVVPPLLNPKPETVTKIDLLLSGLRERPLVALGIGSKMPAKKWFFERYVEIARRVVSSYPFARLIVVGGAEDEAEGARLVAAVGLSSALNLAGALDVVECAELLSRCVVYVGNDTGTMHLAGSMGLRCIAIFTSRDNPGHWEPFGEGHVILRRDLSCSGCMLEQCVERRMECLNLITVDDVWHALEPLLKDAIAHWENNSANQQVRS